MAGQPMPDSVRGQVRQGALAEKRVVLRLRPYETFATPPRHVYSAKDIGGLPHSLGQRLPWKGSGCTDSARSRGSNQYFGSRVDFCGNKKELIWESRFRIL